MGRKKSVRAALLATLAIVGVTATAPSTALAATADLSITKADSADPVSTGSELIYTLTVANAGPDTANGVEVVDELPNQLDFLSASASQGSCERTGKRVTCALGALASGTTATVTIRVVPKKEGQLSNTATVTTTDTDANAQNNSDTETTTVAGEYSLAADCRGKAATIVGTPGDDNIVGTTGRDVIVGRGGNDTIQGLGGRDVVCGSGGNDAIKGQGDNDLLRGGAGEDAIRGGGDGDILRGAGGDDALRGGTGDDALRGGGGNDELRGIGGFDALRGGGGDDTLRGGGGEDRCSGGAGNDTERSC